MAFIAWFEVHALHEDTLVRPAGIPSDPPTIIETGVQENKVVSFHAHNESGDWRVRDFGIQSCIVLTSGNPLFVTESYEDIKDLVKLKVKQGQ